MKGNKTDQLVKKTLSCTSAIMGQGNTIFASNKEVGRRQKTVQPLERAIVISSIRHREGQQRVRNQKPEDAI